MSEKINLAETHVQIKGTELDRLHRAMIINSANVFFARKIDDPHPWTSVLLFTGPYSRGSDPMETSVSPICGYEDSTNYIKSELVINSNSGEVLRRKSTLSAQLGGWKPPIIDNQLFAFVPKEVY